MLGDLHSLLQALEREARRQDALSAKAYVMNSNTGLVFSTNVSFTSQPPFQICQEIQAASFRKLEGDFHGFSLHLVAQFAHYLREEIARRKNQVHDPRHDGGYVGRD